MSKIKYAMKKKKIKEIKKKIKEIKRKAKIIELNKEDEEEVIIPERRATTFVSQAIPKKVASLLKPKVTNLESNLEEEWNKKEDKKTEEIKYQTSRPDNKETIRYETAHRDLNKYFEKDKYQLIESHSAEERMAMERKERQNYAEKDIFKESEKYASHHFRGHEQSYKAERKEEEKENRRRSML